MIRRLILALAPLALVLAACRDNAPPAPPPAMSSLTAEGSDLGAHLDLRIDEALNPEWPLTRVGDVISGGDGRLFVSQPQVPAIQVLDEAGRLTLTIGRRGDGPGEFMGLWAIGLVGDTLFASDPDLGRVSYFTSAGGLIRSRQWVAEMEPSWIEDESRLMLLPAPPVAGSVARKRTRTRSTGRCWMPGEVRGTVSLPRGHRVVAARGTVMIAVEEGPFGVPSLLRYRLSGSAERRRRSNRSRLAGSGGRSSCHRWRTGTA